MKQGVPGANVVEVHFDRQAEQWQGRLEKLDGVTSVQAESAGFYRVLTSSGSKTAMQLVELAASLGETLNSLSVQNTTLDDVFVHYTGRQLRDEQVKSAFMMPPRPGVQLCLILGTSIAFNGMMFLMMVRVDDPLVPRAMFGVLNTLLFFPSGAIYPVAAFPPWLRAIAIVDPFTYAIHGFKVVLLKDGGFVAIQYDLLFLFVFGMGTLLIATPLFKRTL